jgi:acetylornithine deacetylase
MSTPPAHATPTTTSEAALRILGDLVAFPTVTGQPNLELIAYAQQLLEACGARVMLTHDDDHRRANLFATIGPDVDGGVVLSGHTDVVPAPREGWTAPPFEASRRGGAVHGRGTVDMKGFLACVLAMAPDIATRRLAVPLHVAMTFDEEVGCHGAPLLLAQLERTGPRPAVAIVGEPTSMGIVGAHKGCYEHTTAIGGVEGHASAPEKAVSAVEFAVRYVARLMELRREFAANAPADSPFEPAGTTISVGTIEGGSARNVVAGACRFDWEVRTVDRRDADRVDAAVAALEADLLAEMRERDPTAAIATTTVGAVEGLEDVGGSPAVSLARELLADDRAPVQAVPFSTEAGLYQQAGIPAVVCGPGSIDVAHRPDEYVELDQLDRCLAFVDRLGDHLSSPTPG